MTETNLYYTSDLGLAGTLLCKQFLLDAITPDENSRSGRRKFFNFAVTNEEGENAHDVANAYYKNELLVDPKVFNNFQRTLKIKLMNLRNEEERTT